LKEEERSKMSGKILKIEKNNCWFFFKFLFPNFEFDFEHC
jgi:hypothetical protein